MHLRFTRSDPASELYYIRTHTILNLNFGTTRHRIRPWPITTSIAVLSIGTLTVPKSQYKTDDLQPHDITGSHKNGKERKRVKICRKLSEETVAQQRFSWQRLIWTWSISFIQVNDESKCVTLQSFIIMLRIVKWTVEEHNRKRDNIFC